MPAFSFELFKKDVTKNADSTEILIENNSKKTSVKTAAEKLKFWGKDNKDDAEVEMTPKKVFPREVLAPSVQFSLDDYKDYFLKPSDYEVNLQSRNKYLITCKEDIIGINWGDSDGVKIYDLKDEISGETNMKKAVMKLKFETYTYVRLYKSTKEVANIILSVNPVFENEEKIIGSCKITGYEG
ncbi:MAG: hypothetical protein LUE64_02425 [Candidatus Gastranaerophilales bacterium]|nr:hypothetical protein [Candidatus Gastranaerophilales bacterium]